MDKDFETVVTELNYMSSALEFIGDAVECYEAEGKSINKSGLAYLARTLGSRSSEVAELCWEIKTTGAHTPLCQKFKKYERV